MNEFEEAMQNVLDYGMKAIDKLSPEEIAQLESILKGIK
jgi:predicted component of type VI protein secretion system